ncbi:hypothetical protein PMAYCL1PPCAC_06382 [Pristionchus mayeri]|uniref:Uncharacterized protein n=1 Tax=Pristionchus mayeri TaxID=1317129 RepID=A0AAN4Z829_9BILA|nr:hypothetical protein PMAYCL1PPCAC_06382 [Pristionchus mayeri]
MIIPQKFPLLNSPCYRADGICDEYRYDRMYHFFAVVETPITLLSLVPVFILFAFFRKHPDAWLRVKADLAPSLFVLAFSTSIGLYVELHLALTDWLDMRLGNFHCSLSFNFMAIMGSMYYNFIPVALLIHISGMFFRMADRVKTILGYAWVIVLILVNVYSMVFGSPQSTIMCNFANIDHAVFIMQIHMGNTRDFVSIALICQMGILSLICYVLDRFEIRQEILKVDFLLVKQSLALSLPPLLSFLGYKIRGGMQHYNYQSLDDFMFRMFASSLFFGLTASLIILFNYPFESWATFSGPLLCHRKKKEDMMKSIVL